MELQDEQEKKKKKQKKLPEMEQGWLLQVLKSRMRRTMAMAMSRRRMKMVQQGVHEKTS
jgi:hypothetical protein